MGRYFRFDANNFDFAVRADVDWRYDYFSEFVFGGTRDKRIYGLTRLTPNMTFEYDVNGLRFLQYVIGTISANGVTVSVEDPAYIGTIHAGVDGINAGISDAKIDTWEFTVEEGGPCKAEVNAIGRATSTAAPAAYTTDIDSAVVMPYDVGVTINTSSIGFVRFNLRISNGMEAIYKRDTVPATIRATGLEVEGRIRCLDYLDSSVTDGSLVVVVGNVGNIYVPTVKLTEVPPRATGYDLPEVEYTFNGYPTTSDDAISAILSNTVKW